MNSGFPFPTQKKKVVFKSYAYLLASVAAVLLLSFLSNNFFISKSKNVNPAEFITSRNFINSTRLFKDKRLENIRRDRFREIEGENLVLFNCYRKEMNKITAVGMAQRSRTTIDFRILTQGFCIWKNEEDILRNFGNLTAMFPGDHHFEDYETIILECSFESGDSDPLNVGSIFVQINNATFPLCEEIQAENKYLAHSPTDYKFEIGYCSPPTFGHLNKLALLQWLEYHIYIDIQWFVFYDAGTLNASIPKVIGNYSQIEIIDISNIRKYSIWNYGQTLTNNDCLLRLRKEAKWILFSDLDEYVTLPSVDLSFPSFLNPYQGNSCLSFGNLFWSVEFCLEMNPGSETWPFEYLIFKETAFICALEGTATELCPSHFGHRKVVAYTPLTEVVLMHDCLWPKGDSTLDLNGNVAHMSHFRGLTSIDFGEKWQLCWKPHPISSSFPNLVLDTSFSNLSALLPKPRI